jgi:hypothetical protein
MGAEWRNGGAECKGGAGAGMGAERKIGGDAGVQAEAELNPSPVVGYEQTIKLTY